MTRVTRRGFFGVLAAAVTAAALPPSMPAAPVLTFKGVPFVFDEHIDGFTIGGINRQTYKFWRNEQHATLDDFGDELRRVYNQCSRGAMQ